MAVKDKNVPANQGDDFIQAIERGRAFINEEGLVVKASGPGFCRGGKTRESF